MPKRLASPLALGAALALTGLALGLTGCPPPQSYIPAPPIPRIPQPPNPWVEIPAAIQRANQPPPPPAQPPGPAAPGLPGYVPKPPP